jgi:spore coat polysaccharide biosynthesis protein SpsF
MKNSILLITQARISSSRLPGKVTKEISGTTLLGLHLSRIKKSKNISKIIVATTFEQNVESIIQIAEKLGIECFQGSTNDVLDRFYKAAMIYNPDYIVRVTSDCPLLDSELIDNVVNFALNSKMDYCSNSIIESFPDGQDVEVFTFESLKQAWLQAKLLSDREHVTPFILNNSNLRGNSLFSAINYNSKYNYSNVRMTVDEAEDFNCINTLVNDLGIELSWIDYANYILKNSAKFNNQKIIRNEGYTKTIDL